jgi:hypothetical protein
VQAAINALPAGSTIRVCAGTFGAITITKNVTITGVGDGGNPATSTILDAAGSGRVVLVNTGVTATLQGLRITGGVVQNDGGGVFNNGTLTMTGCSVTGNSSTSSNGQGGGIRHTSIGNLTMTNCTISQNSSAIGGGISTLNGLLELTNCTISGNSASVRSGAIEANNGGTTKLTNCAVGPNNVSPFATILIANSSTVTLDATSVTGNTGTGIYNLNGTVILQNGSTVSGNTPNNCDGTITGPGCAP